LHDQVHSNVRDLNLEIYQRDFQPILAIGFGRKGDS